MLAVMDDIAARLARMFETTAAAPGVVVEVAEIEPGRPAGELRELEQGLGVQLSPALRAFYEAVGGVSFRWTLEPATLAARFEPGDEGYIGGQIAILDPFTMVMGKGGRRWEGELYFDFMSPEEQARFRAFVPFDHTGELAPGFVLEDGRVGPAMRLYDASEGLVPFDHTLATYLERLLEARGFFHWPTLAAGSLEQERYERAMELFRHERGV